MSQTPPQVEEAFSMLNIPPKKKKEPFKVWIITVLDSEKLRAEVFSFFTKERADEEAVKMAQNLLDEHTKNKEGNEVLLDFERENLKRFQEETDPVEKLRIFNQWGIGFYIECVDSDVQK